MQRGLAVIASRSEALSRFMGAYARLAKLPPPKLAPVEHRAAASTASSRLGRRALRVAIEDGPASPSRPTATNSNRSSST